MTLSRRTVLQAGLVAVGAAATGALTTPTSARAATSNVSPAGYITRLAPLRQAAFLRLPP